MFQLLKFSPPAMRTRTVFHGNCHQRNICKLLRHFFALQALVFNQPVVAVDDRQVKYVLGDVHTDYWLILCCHFDFLWSLVKVNS